MKGDNLIRAAPAWLTTGRRSSNNDGAVERSRVSTTLDGNAAAEGPPIQLLSLVSPLMKTSTKTKPNDPRARTSGRTEAPTALFHRLALFGVAAVQNSLMGGFVYGWPALSKMLTDDETSRRGCGLTIGETTWLFTVASTTGMISTLLLGYILDRWGPRLCSVCSHAAILSGSFYFAFGATKVVGFGIGISLVAFGGPGIIVSTVHLANLFPSHQFTAMSLLNGTIAFSMSVLALFAMLWDRYRAISYRHLFGAFGLVVGLSLIASILVWPDFSYTPPADYDDDDDNDEHDAATADSRRRRRVPGRDHQRRATNNVALKDDYYVAAATLHQHSVLTIEQPLSSFLRNNDDGHFPGLTQFVPSIQKSSGERVAGGSLAKGRAVLDPIHQWLLRSLQCVFCRPVLLG
jgi:hypothetical protein